MLSAREPPGKVLVPARVPHMYDTCGHVEPVVLRCSDPALVVSSQVLVNLSSRGVDSDAFESIKNCFLVFDNRLVVTNTFRTSDAAIFGAGPLTKYSLRYHSDEWSHARFSSREVGEELAAALLLLLDPTAEAAEPPPELECLVPLYNQAKIQGLQTESIHLRPV